MLVENKVLAEFAELIREKKTQPYSGELKTGVDLGTANIVIAVTDSENHPVAGASAPSHVVKDGIVVDFIGAIRTVKELKAQLEEQLPPRFRRESCQEMSVASPMLWKARALK